jgi:Fe-S oxidoreductase
MNGTRVRARHVAIAIGALVTIVTVGSYATASLFGFHDDSPVSRRTFGNVPDVVEAVFYTLTALLLVYGTVQFANRVRNWERGKPDRRDTTAANVKRRLGDFRAGVYMQTVLRDPAAGVMHSLIYFSFLVLLAVTTVLEIDHQMPESAKFLHGDVYRAYSFVADTAGVLFLAGVVWALVRRYGPWRPYRIRIKSKPEHALILLVFLGIGVTGFGAEAFRIALGDRQEWERWSWVGYPLSGLVDGADHLSGWHQGWWIVHALFFLAFLAILPVTMLRHMFTSPLNLYLRDRERPKGAMKPLPNLMETELETFGASAVEDFTWKQLLDTDACTMCGRCTASCPAHLTGKSLDPREIVLKVGETMALTGTPPVSPPLGVDGDITVSASNVFERITPEEIWACTSCKACDEACPVGIEILDKILDMRRYLSLMESNFPTELGAAYRSMENSSNPWGMSQGERADWARGLDGVRVVDGSAPLDAEYLYFVGCAGSFDDKNRRVTRAMAQLMQRAGVDFAVLGPSELCSGDPARRSGNEYLYQMLAMQNVETFEGMGVRKIVAQCPHCFNTLANEYPQLGGRYEVIHHSQLLDQLISSGRLDLSGASLAERIVYHDSCYLGRHNDVYLAPRRVIASLGGVEVVEAPRNANKGLCCGAGGARMWMEETLGKRVNDARSQELIATGAGRIATACPFCYIMIDDGVKGAGKDDDEVKVADIAIHVLDALQAGDGRRQGAAVAPTVQD